MKKNITFLRIPICPDRSAFWKTRYAEPPCIVTTANLRVCGREKEIYLIKRYFSSAVCMYVGMYVCSLTGLSACTMIHMTYNSGLAYKRWFIYANANARTLRPDLWHHRNANSVPLSSASVAYVPPHFCTLMRELQALSITQPQITSSCSSRARN